MLSLSEYGFTLCLDILFTRSWEQSANFGFVSGSAVIKLIFCFSFWCYLITYSLILHESITGSESVILQLRQVIK